MPNVLWLNDSRFLFTGKISKNMLPRFVLVVKIKSVYDCSEQLQLKTLKSWLSQRGERYISDSVSQEAFIVLLLVIHMKIDRILSRVKEAAYWLLKANVLTLSFPVSQAPFVLEIVCYTIKLGLLYCAHFGSSLPADF